MGLFDNFFNTPTNTGFSSQQAVMNIIVAAVMIDGDIDDDEIKQLRAMCLTSPIFASNTVEQDGQLIKTAVNNIARLKGEAIRRSASSLTNDLRETAFVLAVEMVLADGLLHRNEEVFIDQLADSLGVDEQTAHQAIKITLIKMRSA